MVHNVFHLMGITQNQNKGYQMGIKRNSDEVQGNEIEVGQDVPATVETVEVTPVVKVPTFLNVKKTMEPLAKELVAQGVDKLEGWDKILKLMLPSTPEASTEPKEVTILKDGEGNVIARKCTITNKWFEIERFYKNGTIIKEADGAKNKLYAESKAMESKAKSILDEARTLVDVEAKLAKFEEYDKALVEAKEYRAQPIVVDEKWLEGSFESPEDFLKSIA